MLTTLALLTTMTLAPAQNEGPEFKNDRFTFGILGQSRKDDKFLPGDVVSLAATVKGLKVEKDGMVTYSMGFEISKKGQKGTIQKREPQEFRVLNWLGGGDLPVFAHWPIPRDTDAPGEYTMKITFTDVQGKKSTTLTKNFTVEKTKLGFVQTYFMGTPVSVAGQTLGLQYSLVGFEMDKKLKTSNVTVTIRVLDENGKPTLAKPLTSDIKSDEKDAPGIMIFRPAQIELNRAGKFKVELSAKDNVTDKTTKEVLDLTVVEVK
jgi:hypothetical protein